jgi:hypothetical protein
MDTSELTPPDYREMVRRRILEDDTSHYESRGLRACLVSDRVRLGGSNPASPTRFAGTLRAVFEGQLPRFSKCI